MWVVISDSGVIAKWYFEAIVVVLFTSGCLQWQWDEVHVFFSSNCSLSLTLSSPYHLHPAPQSFQLPVVCLLNHSGDNHYSVCDLNINTLCSVFSFSSYYPPCLLQVFQWLRLSNGAEDAALGELLRLRRVQCEGRGDWKHCPSQSPSLPPTLLWTNRKAPP